MFVRTLQQAEPFQCAGIDFGMVLPRDITGSVEIVWEELKPGVSTPADKHDHFDQVFWILDGEADVTVGKEQRRVGPQTVVFVPRATQHSVRCLSAGGLRYLYMNVWANGIPERDRNWKQIYLDIHSRRVAAGVASEPRP
jgi:mannose-6-phosphate isomerase-like protein (cupin superfamily)